MTLREDDSGDIDHRTSVYLYERHVNYMEEESKNRSKFVRNLIDEHMEEHGRLDDFRTN